METVDFEALEAARRKGFNQGMSAALSCLAVVTALWTVFAVEKHLPAFRTVFEQVHVELPALTALILEHHLAISVGVVLASGIAVAFSVTRGERPVAKILNITAFLVTSTWLALCFLALYLPLGSAFEGIGGRKH